MGTYNGASWIEAQLESFLAQSHENWSLWVSDDGSQDDTWARLEAFARRNPEREVRLLSGPGRGSAANFLHLLCHKDLPKGFVALSDQDDVWLPHKLERALTQLGDPDLPPAAWAARYEIADENLAGQRPSQVWERGPSLGNALVQNIMSGHTLTLNPAALEIVRKAGPVNVPHHDWWIYLLLMSVDATALIDPETALIYRQHGRNVMGVRSSAAARRQRLSAVREGQLGRWLTANMSALGGLDLPLTPRARHLSTQWANQGRVGKLKLLQEFAVHRQARAETALIYLAAALGRL